MVTGADTLGVILRSTHHHNQMGTKRSHGWSSAQYNWKGHPVDEVCAWGGRGQHWGMTKWH